MDAPEIARNRQFLRVARSIRPTFGPSADHLAPQRAVAVLAPDGVGRRRGDASAATVVG
jgi:hypothetical protein